LLKYSYSSSIYVMQLSGFLHRLRQPMILQRPRAAIAGRSSVYKEDESNETQRSVISHGAFCDYQSGEPLDYT
jgi:hypothetical protein